jgi:hypothetical protein
MTIPYRVHDSAIQNETRRHNALWLCRNDPVQNFHIRADHPTNMAAIGSSWAKEFQRRSFLEIDQLETRIAYGGIDSQRIKTK